MEMKNQMAQMMQTIHQKDEIINQQNMRLSQSMGTQVNSSFPNPNIQNQLPNTYQNSLPKQNLNSPIPPVNQNTFGPYYQQQYYNQNLQQPNLMQSGIQPYSSPM